MTRIEVWSRWSEKERLVKLLLRTAITVSVGVLLGWCFLFRVRGDAPSRHFELRAESTQFWELIDRKAQLTRVASGFGFTEGPVWDTAGFLFVRYERRKKIFRFYPRGTKGH